MSPEGPKGVMKMSRWNVVCVASVAAVVATTDWARAHCSEGFGLEDNVVRLNHDTAEADAYLDHHWYNMREKDWLDADRGWSSVEFMEGREYHKHVLAARLIKDGVNFDGPAQELGPLPPWCYPTRAWHHPTADYFEVSKADRTRDWHQRLRHDCSDAQDANATIHYGAWRHRVELKCPIFDLIDDRGNLNSVQASSRAGTFVHEGWHAVLDRQGFNTHHVPCTRNARSNCDTFHPHGLYAFEPGEMYDWEIGAHRTYGAQYELMCDLSVRPASWVPYGAILGASTRAADIRDNHIENSEAVPGCVVATPMGGAPILLLEPVEPLEAGDCEWGACAADTDCGGQYYRCGDAGCCIVVPA